jgi:hypothetical protein
MDRRVQHEECSVARHAGPHSLKIGKHGVPSILRQRQSRLSSALAPNRQRGLPPVDIIETQRDNITRAQAEPR